MLRKSGFKSAGVKSGNAKIGDLKADEFKANEFRADGFGTDGFGAKEGSGGAAKENRSGGLSVFGGQTHANRNQSPFEAEREANRRAALNALRRARRAADKAGIPLSEWEGAFIASVSERIQNHGRAFGDPEKGAPGQAMSTMQGRKLKEIAAKANGEEPKRRRGRKGPATRNLDDDG